MAKNTVDQWDTTAGNNQDVGGIGIEGTNAVNNFDDALRTIMAQVATHKPVGAGVSQSLTAAQQTQARTNISAPLNGYYYRMAIANNATDPTNDIDIAAGEVASTEANPVLMALSSTLTKRLDAAWAVGTNQGMRDTGSIADGWWHIFVIQRSDTGVTDVLASLSATAPTMPTNYDRKRRIASIYRTGGAIKGFSEQPGKIFKWDTPAVDYSSTSSKASVATVMTVPTNTSCRPILAVGATSTTVSSNVAIQIGDGQALSANTAVLRILTPSASPADRKDALLFGDFRVNSAAQIYHAVTISAGALLEHTITTLGWIDVGVSIGV